MKTRFLPTIVVLLAPLLGSGVRAADFRLGPLKDLNGDFSFHPPGFLNEWEARREGVRRRILVSQGLWPEPTRTPLEPVLHGRIDCGEYTVEKGFFQSAPGFYVTGNLYRPKQIHGKIPGVLFAHGHWKDARLSEQEPAKVRQEIASGQERFEEGGKSRFQSMCVQLARMGCVVWQWDMLGDSDSVQFTRELIHGFSKQRPEMNAPERWGLYSPAAEAHLQSPMGLQTWNALRSFEFLRSLPEVDSGRIAMTGSSGGGTQTMILAALEPQLALSFPVVMVSTGMQGGCTCENASLLRVGTGNVEFAGLFAPKPQGMNTANDWTRNLAAKGFPELQALYGLYGKKQNVELTRGEHFPHNYNAVTRSAFYTLLNKHFGLGQPVPVIERDYAFLSRERLTVWDAQHPAPAAGDPEFERSLLQWFHEDAQRKLVGAAAEARSRREVLLPALEVVLGRRWEEVGEVAWNLEKKSRHGAWVEMAGVVENRTHGEQVGVTWWYPLQWNGRAVVWLDGKGRSGLRSGEGALQPAVLRLLEAGVLVVGVDLFGQGPEAPERTRGVENPREFAGYTFGYNHALFAQRVHDVLTVLALLRGPGLAGHPAPERVGIAAWGEAGPIGAAARALAGARVDRAALFTGGFRFGALRDYRHPQFLPGAAKYLDLAGMLAVGAPEATWVGGEAAPLPVVESAYQGAAGSLEWYRGEVGEAPLDAVRWLLR
jgi:dienelactone hydrolase